MRFRTVLAGAALVALATPAFPHALLQHADPGAGAALKQAPAQLSLSFSERLEPSFSTVSVTDAAGHDMAANPAKISGAGMTVALKPLSPGSYRVSWHAVSVDTHRTEGNYSFTVGR